ncbi:uncharacterized protein PHACADRAFT_91797, partial [Phanerochaete carnosa HHB-10118-sp]
PPCAAQDHLRLWRPASSFNKDNSPFITEEDFARVSSVMSVTWAPSTLETYSAGLMLFHAICDVQLIPEMNRAPASSELLCIFLAKLACSYSVSALTNYLAGIQAWHRLHQLPWQLDAAQQQLMVCSAASMLSRLDAERSPELHITRAKCPPITIAVLSQTHTQLDLSVPLDAAVYTCATALLHGIARSDEFTVPKLSAFDLCLHVTIANIRRGVSDHDGNTVTVVHLPCTESLPEGEDIYWGKQLNDTDPDDALTNHERINCPQPEEHLFMHKTADRFGCKQRHPLTEDALMRRLRIALQAAGVTEQFSGYCFWIGSTLEYLLRGLPFEVVKVKGR